MVCMIMRLNARMSIDCQFYAAMRIVAQAQASSLYPEPDSLSESPSAETTHLQRKNRQDACATLQNRRVPVLLHCERLSDLERVQGGSFQ
jgi:hypothetical protein